MVKQFTTDSSSCHILFITVVVQTAGHEEKRLKTVWRQDINRNAGGSARPLERTLGIGSMSNAVVGVAFVMK